MKEILSFIHIHSNRANSKTGLFLLFLPAIIFFMVLTFLVFQYKEGTIANFVNEPDILGIQEETLDTAK